MTASRIYLRTLKTVLMKQIYPAPCGLDCFNCKAYKATLDKDKAQLIKLAEKWSDEHQTYSADDLLCLGCYSYTLYKGCRTCEVRACTTRRGYDNCSKCEEYPCEKLLNEWISWKTVSWVKANNFLDNLLDRKTME
ncbi:DUF3795 domain-containing protein [Candidatus Bathyarchaeota archaeon]|nr:DUF3795 domain-containing protein [Candidatus Bathyarchaeota archaeon]